MKKTNPIYNSDDSLNRIVSVFQRSEPFLFECGKTLDQIKIVYETYGVLNQDRSNAILVCHALTGGANVAGNAFYPEPILKTPSMLGPVNGKLAGWWKDLIGPGKLFDTSKYFVICSNILGSCYGSSGPVSINPYTGKQYGIDFPQVTVRDMVNAQKLLINYLGIDELAMAIGGSLGGMQVLEWASALGPRVFSAIPIATGARHSSQNIAFHEVGRQAVMADPDWSSGRYLIEGKQIGRASCRERV